MVRGGSLRSLVVRVRVGTSARAPRRAGAYNLSAPVKNLATLFTDLFGARRPHRRQRGDAAGRTAALGAFQQRLPVQLQPVQHRAREPARERAAAVAGVGLHLSVRSEPRRVPAHDAELRPDSRRTRRHHRRRPRRRSALPFSVHLRHDRRPRPAPRARGVHARQRGPARRPPGRRDDHQHDRRRPSASPRRSSPSASPIDFDVSVAVPIVSNDLKVVSDATIQRLGTTNPLTHFFRQANGDVGDRRIFTAVGSASGLGDVTVRLKSTLARRVERVRRRARRSAADRRRDESARHRARPACSRSRSVGDVRARCRRT